MTRVVHNVASVGPASFGLGSVALNLCMEQALLEADPHIWCLDGWHDLAWALESSGLDKERAERFSCWGSWRTGVSPALIKASSGMSARFDIVHQHGIWSANSLATLRSGRGGALKSVVAPHGSLESWALRRSRWKKWLALQLYERNNLGHASCLHALSASEADGFRKFGLENPVAVIPNGISQRWLRGGGDAAAFRRHFALPAKRILLFLSRISPVKGLPLLLQALEATAGRLEDWLLVVAGPDEFGHLDEVNTLIRHLGLEERVRIVGALHGEMKLAAFAAAESFVLPSHREAFPLVVLEALGAGIPVLTTAGTPWEELSLCNCGWWVDFDVEAIASALLDIGGKAPKELELMGLRGKSLVEKKYTWRQVAHSTLSLYRWLQNGGEPPPFVRFD